LVINLPKAIITTNAGGHDYKQFYVNALSYLLYIYVIFHTM